MRIRTLALLATTLGITALACAKAATVDPAAEETAIRDIVTRWNEHLVNKDDSAVAAIYAADAVLLPPNEPAVTGSSAIRQYWAALWPLNASLTITPGSVKISQAGDMAWEGGTWTYSAPSPAGPVADNGKYLVVWHKVNGEWKVAQDIWNSNNPLPGTAPDSAAAAK
jgi:ketosteroid isomerase-like protein